MKYFCPVRGTYFEGFDPKNTKCIGSWSYEKIEDNAKDRTIIDVWNSIPVPPAPDLKPVNILPQTTALLILDMETSICNGPRCIASIPKVNSLLSNTRKNNMLVVYSLIPNGTPADIALPLKPLPGDPIVKSSVDKFYRTDLEKILHKNRIKTVIVTGYAANGAVLHTATSAAFRDFNVIIPVDAMSAENPYAEQYTAWHMLNSPGSINRTTLTKVSLINF